MKSSCESEINMSYKEKENKLIWVTKVRNKTKIPRCQQAEQHLQKTLIF